MTSGAARGAWLLPLLLVLAQLAQRQLVAGYRLFPGCLLQRRRLGIRKVLVKLLLPGEPRSLPGFIVHLVHQNPPEVGEESAFPPRLKCLYMIQRSQEGDLHKIIGVREIAHGAGHPAVGPAAQRVQEALHEGVPCPGVSAFHP